MGDSGYPKKNPNYRGFSGRYGKEGPHRRYEHEADKRDNNEESFGNRYGQFGKRNYRGFDRRGKKERRY